MMTGTGFATDFDDDARCLHAFVTGGQDKAAVAAIFAALETEMQPQNLIERMWLRDIARLTTRIEELRLVQVAVHKHLLHRSTPEDAGPTPGAAVAPALALTGPTEPHDPINDHQSHIPEARAAPSLEQLLGMTYAENLAIFDQLARLEGGIRAERDRVISQIDTRRRNALEVILSALGE